jgi:hypothetical protein
MNLYLANGTYVGTQADARAITKDFTAVEVPTDKAGLIAYLNSMDRPGGPGARAAGSTPAPVPFSPPGLTEAAQVRNMGASDVLSRIDGPADIDALVETICASSGYPLKRFAGAVACAFTRLADGVR